MSSWEAERLVTDAERLWKACVDSLRGSMSEATWKAWFDQTCPDFRDDITLTVGAPSSVVKQRLEERFSDDLEGVIADTVGEPRKVSVIVDDPPAQRIPAHEPRSVGPLANNDEPISHDPPPPPRHGEPGTPRSRVHFRHLRHWRVELVRARRSPRRGREPWPGLQPVVRLRRVWPRQDPPVARHRELRAAELPAPPRSLRHHRDVHERVRRRHSYEHHRSRSSAATASATCC